MEFSSLNELAPDRMPSSLLWTHSIGAINTKAAGAKGKWLIRSIGWFSASTHISKVAIGCRKDKDGGMGMTLSRHWERKCPSYETNTMQYVPFWVWLIALNMTILIPSILQTIINFHSSSHSRLPLCIYRFCTLNLVTSDTVKVDLQVSLWCVVIGSRKQDSIRVC